MRIRSMTFQVSIIVLALLIFWRQILQTHFIGEGFMYFADWVSAYIFSFPLPYEIGAKVLFSFLMKVFLDNVYLYMAFALIWMVLTDIALYFVLFLITKKRTVAILGTLFFGFSHAAQFDMYAGGGYQYFIQRGLLLFFMLISYGFLAKYLKEEKIKYYIISLAVFVFTIATGYFATWFLPAVFFLPIFYLTKKKISKISIFDLVKTFIVAGLFVVGNYIMIKDNGYYKDGSFFDFIINPNNFVLGILQQLSVLTLPQGTINGFILGIEKLTFGNFSLAQNTFLVGIFVVTLHSIAWIVVRRKNREWSAVMLASFFSLIIMLLLNMYKNNTTVLASFDTSRYFYYACSQFAIFWAIFFGAVLSYKNKLVRSLAIGFVLFFVINNYNAMQTAFSKQRWNHVANHEITKSIKELSPQLIKGTYTVYLPTSVGPYGVVFLHKYYSNPQSNFYEERIHPLDFSELVANKVEPEMLYVFHLNTVTQLVEDKTEESRVKLSAFYASQSSGATLKK